MKWLEYTLTDLEEMEASGLPIRAKLYYWDQKRVKILDVERIDFDLWEIVVKQGKEFQYIAIHLCELSTVEPQSHEDLREATRPNSK